MYSLHDTVIVCSLKVSCTLPVYPPVGPPNLTLVRSIHDTINIRHLPWNSIHLSLAMRGGRKQKIKYIFNAPGVR